MLDLYKRESFE